MSISIFEAVKAALEKDHQQYLLDIEANLKKRINDAPKRTADDLLSFVKNIFLSRKHVWCSRRDIIFLKMFFLFCFVLYFYRK